MQQELYAAVYQDGLRSTIRLLRSKGLLPEDAEEVAQAAWVRGWEAKDQLKRSDRVIPWVNSIAVNTMYNQKRRSQRIQQLDESKHRHASTPGLPARIDAENLLSRCSQLDRSLIIHRYVGGYEMDEIARIHGLTCVATRVRIHRAKVAMRQSTGRKPIAEAA